MKKILSSTILLLFISAVSVFAQSKQTEKEVIPKAQLDSLKKFEERLMELGDSMVDGSAQPARIKALMRFIPTLVQALKVPGSFDYSFDSLRFMQKLIPQDKKFKLYSWLLKYDDQTFRYYSVIQMNNPDSLVLFPLRDYSMMMEDSAIENMTFDQNTWFGAFYYDIIQTSYKRKTYYTLLGWDGHTHMSNKKIIEPLSFDEEGKPVFGAPIFDIDGKIQNRVVFNFNNDATMMVLYVPEYEMITYDHLVPPNPAAKGEYYTYVPDGTYDYFRFKKGKWIWGEELFDKFNKPIKEAGDIKVEDPKKKRR